MLNPEQTQQIKQQLISQIGSSKLDNKESIKKQILAMNQQQLESFLKQNNLINSNLNEKCVFCSISSGEIQSYKIDENSEAIAVLEINPISKGHALVIPKKHSENAPEKALDLAKKIAKKISGILNPKKIEIIEDSMFGHEIINILPIYKDETMHSQKKQAQQGELKKLQDQILSLKIQESRSEKKAIKDKPKTKTFTDNDTWLPKRVP